jgi:hypothetical protein
MFGLLRARAALAQAESQAAARVPVISPSPTPRPAPPIELSPALEAELRDKRAIADVHMNHASYDDAIQAYQDALRIDPSNQQARQGLRKARQLP